MFRLCSHPGDLVSDDLMWFLLVKIILMQSVLPLPNKSAHIIFWNLVPHLVDSWKKNHVGRANILLEELISDFDSQNCQTLFRFGKKKQKKKH